MRIVWCSWKDIKHPLAGGAEQVTHNLLKRLAADGHEVLLLTSRPKGAGVEDEQDGYKIIRQGNRFSVYPQTARYFKKHLRGWPNLVVDETNTIPFFAKFYAGTKTISFFHQLARDVWFYQMPLPLSYIGYWLEPLYLRLLADQPVITVSQSTKADLIRNGFSAERIQIIRLGIEITPVKNLDVIQKYDTPTLLALGAIRPMKRTDHIVRAFEHAKKAIPNLKLIIAGDNSGPYADKVMQQVAHSLFKGDVQILGRVTKQKKEEIMQRSHIQVAASVKEGWGLTVTEANSQGTPVAAYDIDGLRDSVKNGKTGVIANPNPRALGDAIVELLSDTQRYTHIRKGAWEDSKQYTFANSYNDFMTAIGNIK